MQAQALTLVHRNSMPQKRDYINHSTRKDPIEGVLFADYITKTVSENPRNAESLKKAYRTLALHVNHFCEVYNASIYTNSVTDKFLNDFILFLEGKNLSQNYINHLLCLAKAMAANAGLDNYATDTSYRRVEYKKEAPFSVYLNKTEIDEIYFYRGLSAKKERIRDLFVFGCLTGFRYSDYSNLSSDNFDGDYIIKITQKTRAKVMIPQALFVRQIYQKYNGNINWNLSIQHFNRYIKEICKEIGFNQLVKKTYTRGGRIITEVKPKYEFISSHTARRSFATNMYLMGYKPFQIMAFTGHTTEKSFFRYIKITQEDTVRQIANDRFFTA
nr:site-specific integrase [uncultured Draconibacterium sp.]